MGNSFLAGIFSDRGLGRVRRLLLFLLGAGKGAQGKALGHRIVPRAAKGLAPWHRVSRLPRMGPKRRSAVTA